VSVRKPSAAFHAFISGRVQGVGFRYTALREAERLGVTGYVRNLDDGDVEILAEGDPPDLDRFLSWLNTGPSGAWIERVDMTPIPPSGAYHDFEVEY
jgi:acylphosphatase